MGWGNSTDSIIAILTIIVMVVGLVVIVPATFSPVTVAAGQTQMQLQGQSQSAGTIELDSNNTTRNTVVIEKAKLPEGGFIAVHGVGYARRGVVQDSTITVSQYLSPGIHRNITIPIKRGVPGMVNNQTRLDYARPNLSVIAYQDTNNNTQFDFVASFGENDTSYQAHNKTVVDTETVVLETNVQQINQRSQSESVQIQFKNQRLRHAYGYPVLTVQNATLPKGGFIVIHKKRYLKESQNPVNSVIGLSLYLKPGTHRNITVRLLNGSVSRTQTLVAVAYLDTDGDHSYNFVRTGGETDYAYIQQQNGSAVIVNDTATIHVPQPKPSTPATATATTTQPAPTNRSTVKGEDEKGGGILAENLRFVIGGLLVLIIALVIIIFRIKSRKRRF